MKKREKFIAIAMCTAMAFSVVACGKDKGADDSSLSVSVEDVAVEASSEASSEEAENFEVPEGMYLSEITGEPISEELKDQRPVAVMVDNEKTALPHFGTSEADVVYELMNSTQNDRITRLMCIVKDWDKIEQMGSVRSTRPTNILLAGEWNAVLCHDGGPFYIDEYLKNPWAQHFSGTFQRVKNGKPREFTEYVCKGDLDKNFSSKSSDPEYSKNYTQYKNEGSHFNFAPYGKEVDLTKVYDRTYPATEISLPFWHNTSTLKYNDETKEYEYYEYGSRHEDGEDNEPLSFKNVLIQKCDFHQYDEHGYLIYNCIAAGQPGWYITNGVAKDITWVKDGDNHVTKYYDENGKEIQINTGKTYITLVPSDTWDSLTMK